MNKNELYILYGRNIISKHKHWLNIYAWSFRDDAEHSDWTVDNPPIRRLSVENKILNFK